MLLSHQPTRQISDKVGRIDDADNCCRRNGADVHMLCHVCLLCDVQAREVFFDEPRAMSYLTVTVQLLTGRLITDFRFVSKRMAVPR